jgi:uncharacterized protein
MTDYYLDIRDLTQEGWRFHYLFELEKLNKELREVQLYEPLVLEGEAYKFGEKVILKGRVSSTLSLVCSRCLETFHYPLYSNFILDYFPQEQEILEEEKELEEQELNTSFYTNNKIDLLVIVKEQVFLSIPIKPLCTSQCKGLCPDCGCNLNRAHCTCFTERIDNRLLILKKIRV